MSQIKLYDNLGQPLPLINIRLGINGQSEEEAYDERFIDHAGNTAWPNPLPSNSGYDLYVNYRNVNDTYLNKAVHVNSLNEDIIIQLDRTSLDKLGIHNKRLYKPGAIPFFLKGESAFLDYYRLLRGEDIRPLLEQSARLGANCRRNFLMTYNTGAAGGIGPQEPEKYGNDFYDRFYELMGLYAEYGQWGYFSIFPDNQLFANWNHQTGKQINHWNRLGNIAAGIPNVFGFELTNEPRGHSFNQVDALAFNRIPGLLCCSGSYGDEGNNVYPPPHWDFSDFHPPRGYPKSVKDCCQSDNPSYNAGHAVLVGEPLGFGDPNLNSNRSNDPELARKIAGTAPGTTLGIFYHSQHGGFSQLYDSTEGTCGHEWFDVLKGV